MITKKQENWGIICLLILFTSFSVLNITGWGAMLSSTFPEELEVYFKILLSACLGLLIGIDRTMKSKPLGLKTYTILAMGSCLITIISILAVNHFAVEGLTQMDPMRLVAQLLPAVGFVGAGAIYFSDSKVKGLTSAAFVFFTAAIGVGVGTGFYDLTTFTMLVLFCFLKLEGFLERLMNK